VDDLSKLMGGLESAGVSGSQADSLGGLAAAVREGGGLDGLMAKLQAGGLGDAAASWVGTGPNQAVDPQRLGDALGPETVDRLSAGSGMSVAALLPMLAAFLPQIIDMLTPHGTVPAGGLNGAARGASGDIGGMLGGLLGAAGGTGNAAGAGGPDLGAMLGGLMGGPGGPGVGGEAPDLGNMLGGLMDGDKKS
jgi:uncharacterized protein YidB (DUF937 family)